MTVEIQKVESEHYGSAGVELSTPSSELLLKLAEVRTALLVEHDGLAIKDGGTDSKAFSVRLDRGETMRPIVATARENADIAVVEMHCDPISVPFDLVRPIVTNRWPRL
ncbi:hypothetical protein BN77_p11275 [Rhizobium mesoamericanum STM3625]|uniref:Uncharacterized protein n=1 Tax=Rhizobium mesoamericanum STM3625 TaxID=1211777 RepID=K0Q5J5_9HYPH|nr:hypothetical protein BN77_p11275 [Rhizobium mesoamericanum STM3625]